MNEQISYPLQNVLDKLDQLENKLTQLFTYLKQEPKQVRENQSDIGGIDLAMLLTGLSKSTIYKKVSSRRIPHIKKGGKVYFSKTELIAWLKEGRKPTFDELKDSFGGAS